MAVITLAVFTAGNNEPPTTLFARADNDNGHPVLAFDADTEWFAIFTGRLIRSYTGNGITASLGWWADTATTNNVRWTGQFARNQDETTDMDAAPTYSTRIEATSAAPSTNGFIQYVDIPFTDGAQIDSMIVGESFQMRISRDVLDAADLMAGDAFLHTIELRETS